MNDLNHDNHGLSKSGYIRIFVALLLLLGLTVAAAQVPYERWHLAGLGVLIALLIAIAKALLVAMYFMHARWESRATRVFMAAGVIWLAILFGLTLNDYLS